MATHAEKDDSYPSEKNDFDLNEKGLQADGDIDLKEEQENSPIDAVAACESYFYIPAPQQHVVNLL
jgi:hypothetical protein